MPTIHVPEGATEALVGIVVSSEETTRILEDIGARVEQSGTALLVTPPSWRPDLVDVPGLVEEVARIVGYDTIPSSLPQAPAGRGLTREQAAKRRTMAALAASGMTEVLSYPFVTEADNVLFAKSLDMRDMALHNAIDTQINRMRVSLLPGLIEVAKRNMSRGFTSLALYEAGLVFDATGQETGTADIPPGGVRPSPAQLNTLYSSTPPQPWSVAGMFVGSARHAAPGQGPVPSDVRDALDAAHIVARALGGSFSLRQATHSAFHPGRCAELLIGDVVVGVVGELLPSLAFERDMPRRVSVFEIDGDAALALIGSAVPVAFALSAFPAATQDVSLVVDQGIPAGDIQATLAEGAGELLEGIALVDDYRGDGVEPGHRSLTFALRFRAADKTLTALEATEAKDRGVALAALRHGAALRA
jgi:phenylalanyl-tRNA synthetase beta chain